MTMNEGADYWRNIVGVNVIPANTKVKGNHTEWKQYQDAPISQEQHDQWKKDDAFKNGLAPIMGKVWHIPEKSDYYLCCADLDNKKAIEEMMPKGIEYYAKQTLIEMHKDNPNKCHFYCYTMKPAPKKSSDMVNPALKKQIENNEIPSMEVKGEGKHGIMFASPSVHKHGYRYEIIDCQIPMLLDPIVQIVELVCSKYGINYLKNVTNNVSLIPMAEIKSDDAKIIEGGRHEAMLRFADSVYKKALPNTTDKIILEMVMAKNKIMCEPPLDESEIIKLQKQAKEKVKEWNQSTPIETRAYELLKQLDRKPALAELTKWNSEQVATVTDTELKAKFKQAENKIIKELTVVTNENNVTLEDMIIQKHEFVTLRKTGEILTWDGKIYNRSDAITYIKQECYAFDSTMDKQDREEIVDRIKIKTYVAYELFDADPNMITLNNGVMNLDTFELLPHSRTYMSRVLLPVEYHTPIFEINNDTIFEDIEKNLKDTFFWNFLKSSFTIDEEFREENFQTALEVMASIFIKKQIDEKAFMNLGKGDNGKSVYLDYIKYMIGKSNISNVQLQQLAEDKFMAAELDGKLANIFTDLESNELRKTGKVKSIISNEGIQAQRKHLAPFSLYPFSKLIFSSNRFPKVFDQTQGFFRRWIIIPWERNFENDPERDEHLKSKLRDNQEELNLVFSSLIHLAKKIHVAGKFTHSKDWKTTQKEWNENADPVNNFIENCIVDSEENESVRNTYAFYKAKMLDMGENPLRIGQFGKAFAEYYDQDKVREGKHIERVWLNIGFIEAEFECEHCATTWKTHHNLEHVQIEHEVGNPEHIVKPKE